MGASVVIRRIRSNDEYFAPSMKLMHNSFVDDELRNDDALRTLTDGNPLFSFNIIQNDKGERVGLITTWNFGKILYVEHFAIEPDLRGAGYGKAAIDCLSNKSKLPIILEVEMPETSEDAKRRVRFYESLGLCGWQTPYMQPAYSKEKNPLPMMLMAKGIDETIEGAGIVIALLHRQVYGVRGGMLR